MTSADVHYISRPLLRSEDENGDLGVIIPEDSNYFLGLIDVLGHGRDAHQVALIAREYLEANSGDELTDIVKGLHEALKGTRGAVGAVCRINLETGSLNYSGVGNITVKILGPRPFTLVPREGIIGYMIPTPRELHHKLVPGDVLVMYSDGIKEHFDVLECAGLLKNPASGIAELLLEQFGKRDDDASCIVLKLLR